MQPTRVLRRPAVIQKTGLCATTLYNLEKRGDFPSHFMLTPRCAVWDEGEVDAWLAKRRATRMQPQATPDRWKQGAAA